MQKKSSEILLVWDTDEELLLPSDDLLNWQSYEMSVLENVFSIQRLIEENAEHLRSKYLAYIYDLGELRINGKRVVDHLELRPNFSYWWMTLLTEKCNFAKSPQINNIIKLMALEQWLQDKKYHKVRLVSDNHILAKSISLLAKKLLIDFEWQKEQNKSPKINLLKRVFHKFPNVIELSTSTSKN